MLDFDQTELYIFFKKELSAQVDLDFPKRAAACYGSCHCAVSPGAGSTVNIMTKGVEVTLNKNQKNALR